MLWAAQLNLVINIQGGPLRGGCALNNGTFTAIALLILYVLGALKFSRNHFVGSIVEMSDYDKTLRDWNLKGSDLAADPASPN